MLTLVHFGESGQQHWSFAPPLGPLPYIWFFLPNPSSVPANPTKCAKLDGHCSSNT
jgi:hypothetical protein